MTKYVYPNAELPHLFAADKSAYAANSGRSIRVESGKIYSYAEPIGAWFGEKVLLSSDSFSVTTSKHQSRLRYAVNHIESVNLPRLKAILGNVTRNIDEGARYIAARAKEIETLQESGKRLRADWTKRENAGKIAALESACAFVWNEWCNQKTPWQNAIAVNDKAKLVKDKARYTQARNQLESGLGYAKRIIDECREQISIDATHARFPKQAFWRLDSAVKNIRRIDIMAARQGSATFAHAAKIMGKKWAKECTALAVVIDAFADTFQPEIDAMRADFDKAERALHAGKIAAWLAGESVEYPYGLPVACRVIGQRVETSKGAVVPLAQALQFVALAKACRESGKGLDLKGRAIGPYSGNSISATGDLIVGCHRIEWDAITDCVARYEATL